MSALAGCSFDSRRAQIAKKAIAAIDEARVKAGPRYPTCEL